jgi:hypothetical protein
MQLLSNVRLGSEPNRYDSRLLIACRQRRHISEQHTAGSLAATHGCFPLRTVITTSATYREM